MHRVTSERLGQRTALRFKQHGIFRDLSWCQYRSLADSAAAGFLELGIQPGDRIGLLSENRYEWLVADIALLCVAAVDVPMHAPLSESQVAYQLGHSQARGVMVSNQAQADKVLAVAESLPELEFVISFDEIDSITALRHWTWAGLVHRGRAAGRPSDILDREASLKRETLATIIYTSGTTGTPKGVMLTHGNLLSNAEGVRKVIPPESNDLLLSWLPYSHIYARTVDHYLTILSQATVALAESMDTLAKNLQELQPTWLTAVPRFYEKVWSAVEHLEPDERNRELRRFFGRRMRRLTSGGAPLPRHVCDGFSESGLLCLEGYGLTETSPVISFNYDENYRLGSVGRAIPEVEVRIADDGEILTRGPHVMRGYWQNPEATAEVIKDGWFSTGDIGRLDADGFLFITDRKKDLIITSGGKNIAPSVIERALVSDPYIDQAVVYGDGKKFITALIVPNFDTPDKVIPQEERDSVVDDELMTTPEIREFFEERVGNVMRAFSRPERVRKFLILNRPFQMELGELTASLKVRRRAIIEKYRDRLEALYTEESRG